MAIRSAKLAAVPALGLGLAFAPAPAQASATQTATATSQILEDIQFAVLLDMNFGKIALANTASGGDVRINPADGTRNCDPGLVCMGTFGVSKLVLTGSDANVQVNFAPTFNLFGPGDPIVAEPQFPGGPGAVVRLTGGHREVNFGAVLHINPGQAPGVYSGQFTVNLEYY